MDLFALLALSPEIQLMIRTSRAAEFYVTGWRRCCNTAMHHYTSQIHSSASQDTQSSPRGRGMTSSVWEWDIRGSGGGDRRLGVLRHETSVTCVSQGWWIMGTWDNIGYYQVNIYLIGFMDWLDLESIEGHRGLIINKVIKGHRRS